MKTERQVGEKFSYAGRNYTVKAIKDEDKNLCSGCILETLGGDCRKFTDWKDSKKYEDVFGVCTKGLRQDNRNVVFTERFSWKLFWVILLIVFCALMFGWATGQFFVHNAFTLWEYIFLAACNIGGMKIGAGLLEFN